MRVEPETVKLKDGRTVLVRNAQKGDGVKVHAYLSVLGGSTDFILTTPEDIRPAQMYEENIERIQQGEFYSISAIDPVSGSIVGNTSFNFGTRKKITHVAGLGTGVLPEWQGVGLGSWMLCRCIEDMRANPKIHRLELTVIKGNDNAQRMYERAGFVVEGCKSRSIRQPDGSHVDEIQMGMWIGE